MVAEVGQTELCELPVVQGEFHWAVCDPEHSPSCSTGDVLCSPEEEERKTVLSKD